MNHSRYCSNQDFGGFSPLIQNQKYKIMFTNKLTSLDQGNSETVNIKQELMKLKPQYHCNRCSEAFSFAFQLRQHLRLHLLKSPSVFLHNAKKSTDSPTPELQQREEFNIKDGTDLCPSNQKSLPSKQNNLSTNDFHLHPFRSNLVSPKIESCVSDLSARQSRKRKSSETVIKRFSKLKHPASVKNSLASPSCTASRYSFEPAAEEAVENSDSSQKDRSSIKSFTFGIKAENKATSSKKKMSAEQIMSPEAVLGFDSQDSSLKFESSDGLLSKIYRSYVENILQNKQASFTELPDTLNSEDVKTNVVSLGDINSAEDVSLSENFQPDSGLQRDENLEEPSTSQFGKAKSFVCSLCGASYSKNAGLALHLLAHERREMIVNFKKQEKAKRAKAKLDKTLLKTEGFSEETVSADVSDDKSSATLNQWVPRESEFTAVKRSSKTKMSGECVSAKSLLNITDSEIEDSNANNKIHPKDSDMECIETKTTSQSGCNSTNSGPKYLNAESVYVSASSESKISTLNNDNPTSEHVGEIFSNSSTKYSTIVEALMNEKSGITENLPEDSAVAHSSADNDGTPDHWKFWSSDQQLTPGAGGENLKKESKKEKNCYSDKLKLMACEYCHTLLSKRNMARHRSIHCPVLTLPCTKVVECHICSNSLLSEQLSYHLEMAHGQGVLRKRSCNVCFKTDFESFAALQLHKKEHFLNIKNIDFKADEKYDAGFPGCGTLCPICQTETLTASNIRRHIVGHLLDKECMRKQIRRDNKFLCPVCLRSYELNSRIENHILSHWKIRLFECPMCRLLFTRYDVLERHAKKHRRNITDEQTDIQKFLEISQDEMFENKVIVDHTDGQTS